MNSRLNMEAKKRQKTLLASLLLSLWAPLATGVAVLMNRSVTQFADFIRRTLELLVLLLSWLVFRYLTRGKELDEKTKIGLERAVDTGVAVALGISGLIMLFLTLFHLHSFKTVGNVIPGLVVALLGLIVNFWFWLRYRALVRADFNPVIDVQRRLYLAKIFVDICVVASLGTMAFMPAHAITRSVDTLGSIAVAIYLLFSSFRIWNNRQRGMELT